MGQRGHALIETADVARRLDVTPAAVRQAARDGRLKPAIVTPRGQRLFLTGDVDEFARQRGRHRRVTSTRRVQFRRSVFRP
jgi:hypothetical protein